MDRHGACAPPTSLAANKSAGSCSRLWYKPLKLLMARDAHVFLPCMPHRALRSETLAGDPRPERHPFSPCQGQGFFGLAPCLVEQTPLGDQGPAGPVRGSHSARALRQQMSNPSWPSLIMAH